MKKLIEYLGNFSWFAYMIISGVIAIITIILGLIYLTF